jgi:ethanolamine utilization protein EutN
MLIGKVVGSIWATRKDEKLNGLKFLMVRKMDENYELGKDTLVAADSVGAGVGDVVMITKGSSARTAFQGKDIPVDAVIVAIIDNLEVDNE